MRDIASNIKAEIVLPPGDYATSGDGNVVDTLGFNSLAFVITTGAITGAGDFSVTVEHSDDGNDFADVFFGLDDEASPPVIGSWPTTLTPNGVFKLGYIGFKRFVRLVVTKNGGTSIMLAAIAIKGGPSEAPVVEPVVLSI